jgi:hypothetical protein
MNVMLALHVVDMWLANIMLSFHSYPVACARMDIGESLKFCEAQFDLTFPVLSTLLLFKKHDSDLITSL